MLDQEKLAREIAESYTPEILESAAREAEGVRHLARSGCNNAEVFLHHIAKILREAGGQSLVEFALVLPIMLGLAIFLCDAGGILWTKATAEPAARMIARDGAIHGIRHAEVYGLELLDRVGPKGATLLVSELPKSSTSAARIQATIKPKNHALLLRWVQMAAVAAVYKEGAK